MPFAKLLLFEEREKEKNILGRTVYMYTTAVVPNKTSKG